MPCSPEPSSPPPSRAAAVVAAPAAVGRGRHRLTLAVLLGSVLLLLAERVAVAVRLLDRGPNSVDDLFTMITAGGSVVLALLAALTPWQHRPFGVRLFAVLIVLQVVSTVASAANPGAVTTSWWLTVTAALGTVAWAECTALSGRGPTTVVLSVVSVAWTSALLGSAFVPSFAAFTGAAVVLQCVVLLAEALLLLARISDIKYSCRTRPSRPRRSRRP